MQMAWERSVRVGEEKRWVGAGAQATTDGVGVVSVGRVVSTSAPPTKRACCCPRFLRWVGRRRWTGRKRRQEVEATTTRDAWREEGVVDGVNARRWSERRTGAGVECECDEKRIGDSDRAVRHGHEWLAVLC